MSAQLVKALIFFHVLILPHSLSSSSEVDILGCGGFIKSNYPLDFSQIEIKLFTKQGSLKMKTECAPTTGYYFIPLESKGEYILKISPPEGLSFDPPEISLNFDGSSDMCSLGQDINFVFSGFRISGTIQTQNSGLKGGPSAVSISLTDKGSNEVRKTSSKEGGVFSFDKVPPGKKYILNFSMKGASFVQDALEINVDKNLVIENKIFISGYEISGEVKSDKSGVGGVSLLLLSNLVPNKNNIGNCESGKLEGITLPPSVPQNILCHLTSDNGGKFMFKNVLPGKYTLLPMYKGQNIVYNLSPEKIDFELGHSPTKLPSFEVDGFTVLGKVEEINSKSIILVNGVEKATVGPDGVFSIPKMKPGSYEFQVIADKFEFEKKTIKITASSPILPNFSPSKYEICGSVSISTSSPYSLTFEKMADKKDSAKFKESKKFETQNPCIFLPFGKFTLSISGSNRYFTPSSLTINVPGSSFKFEEFRGSLSGKIKFLLQKAVMDVVLYSNGEKLHKIENNADGSFEFRSLVSGEYKIKIEEKGNEKISCWKETAIPVNLKDKNVNDLIFTQTGFPIDLASSHETDVKIYNAKKTLLKKIKLGKGDATEICISEYSEIYKIIPEGCHIFDESEYEVKIGKSLKFEAKLHEFSGALESNGQITDLIIKRNGENLEKKHITEKKVGDKWIYSIKLHERADTKVKVEFFSYGFIFSPTFAEFKTGNDCASGVFSSTAKQSHVIRGKIVPPIEGVEIKIELSSDPDSLTFVTSNVKGQYVAGPFSSLQGLTITPSLPGYSFSPIENELGSFRASEWSRIQVGVASDKGEPIGNVLLSLSGPGGYRLNKMTDESGEMVFSNLEKGTYFLKPLLREFTFEPSAIHIDLKEQEKKIVKISGRRESFSLYGSLSSLPGDNLPELVVKATGLGNCSEYAEEGTSDEGGNFRIFSLKSYCKYNVEVEKSGDFSKRVERTIPNNIEITIGAQDVKNNSFIIIQPVRRSDVSLRLLTSNPSHLNFLSVSITTSNSDKKQTILSTVQFNGFSYIVLPPLPKDGSEISLVFESSLDPNLWSYSLPPPLNFKTDETYAHFNIRFEAQKIISSEEVGKNSYFAFVFMLFIFGIVVNFERIGKLLKEFVERVVERQGVSKKKTKTK